MKWSKVRKLYPDSWIMVTALHSLVADGKQYVDEVAVVRTIENDREARNTLMQCRGDTFVYHTRNDKIVIDIIPNPAATFTHTH